jgi:hypothetical protein
MPTAQATPSFETVWAALQEVAANQKETDRILRENQASQKETDRILKESKKALDIQIGSLTNLFGDFTIGMVAPKLRENFSNIGLVFPKASLNYDITDRINNISFEVDIMLENGDKAMLVEVKTKLTKERIIKHIERLEKMRKYADIHGDKRLFLGAVAGFSITNEIKNLASSEGFYLIEPSGESFNITPPENKPREW